MSSSIYGWLWQRNKWQRVCGPYPSLSACSQELGRIADERGVPAKHQVMTGGAVPNFRPAGKRSIVTPQPPKAEEGAGPSGAYLEGR